MKKISRMGQFLTNAVILVILFSFTACEDNDYELLDPDSAGVWTIYNTSNSGLPGNTISDMAVDNDGNLWIACTGSGVAKLAGDKWTGYNTSNSGLLSNNVTAIEATSDGRIFVGTGNGIATLGLTGTWTSYVDPLVSLMEVNSIRSTSTGSVWIGTDNEGLYVKDATDYLHTTTGLTVFTLEEDKSGNVWVGANNGLLRWNGTSWTNISNTEGLPSGSVTSLLADSKDRMWIGILNDTKVYWRDSKGIHPLSLMTGLVGNDIRDICEDKKGDLWFATYGSGLVRYDGVVPHPYKYWDSFSATRIPENNVNCVISDQDGNMWFGLATKGLLKYTLPLE